MDSKELIATPFNAYSKESEYDEQVLPHLVAAHAACERLGLPFVAAVCVMQQAGGNNTIAATAHLNGMENTPAEMASALSAIKGDWQQIVPLMLADKARCEAAREAVAATEAASTVEG